MRVSTLDYLLVGLLLGGPRSGYDLRKWIGQSPLRIFSDSPGAIYPAIRRLSKRGWIRADEPVGGRRRRALETTREGQKAFVEWLHQPVELQEVIAHGDDVLLRFAFMGPLGLWEQAKLFLEQYEKANVDCLETLRQHDAEEGTSLPLTGRMTFELGMEQFEVRIKWARRSLAMLKADEHRNQEGGSE